jgi:pyroglutamyl-peptidase
MSCWSKTSVEDFSLPREPLSVQLNATACSGVAAGDFAEDLLDDLLDEAGLNDDDFEEDLVAMELFPVGRPINGWRGGIVPRSRLRTTRMRPMTTVLLTGFGAPFNPTGLLVEALACGRPPGMGSVRRVAHVFPTAYDAVDRELPALLARERPDVLLMFGLSWRARMLRIESRARNVLSPVLPDADGQWPKSATIAPDAPAMLPLSTIAPRLVTAARGAGMPAALSRDAGRYLCNYLCWRAAEAAALAPRLFAFIHVPRVHPGMPAGFRGPPFAFEDLVYAGEAITQAALRAARAEA